MPIEIAVGPHVSGLLPFDFEHELFAATEPCASVRVIGAQDIEDQNTRRAVDRLSRRPGDTRSRACGSPKQCRDDVLNSNRHWPAPYATRSARGFAI
jgi:hypothetical protein